MRCEPSTDALHRVPIDMPCPFGMTACAGTEIAQDFSTQESHSVLALLHFTAEAFIILRYRWFKLSLIDQDSQLLPQMCSDRVSVPTGRYSLSSPLGVPDLVSRYLTNYLDTNTADLLPGSQTTLFYIRYSQMFIPKQEARHRIITPSFAMATALYHRAITIRLACLRRTARHSPEPEPNSLHYGLIYMIRPTAKSPIGPPKCFHSLSAYQNISEQLTTAETLISTSLTYHHS